MKNGRLVVALFMFALLTGRAAMAQCHVVAGASLDFPVQFTPDPPMPAIPSLIDSSNSLSGRSEAGRLKVMRIFYVPGVSPEPASSVDGVLGYWKQIADSGKVNSEIHPRVVSGLSGQIAEASLSIQSQPYHGFVLAVSRDRTLWQFITVFTDTPFARTLMRRALESVKVPGECD
jgi:hypothetical protein